LSIAADAVNITILQKWRAHNRVQMRGIFFARLLRSPRGFGRRSVPLQPQHKRSAVKARKKEQVIHFAGSRYAHARTRYEGLRPEQFAGNWIQRVRRFWIPKYQLPFSSGFDYGRRAVAGLLGG